MHNNYRNFHFLYINDAILSQPFRPVISFTKSAPKFIASDATSDLYVSIEIKVSGKFFLIKFITGVTLFNSSVIVTGEDPGRDDSPPMS